MSCLSSFQLVIMMLQRSKPFLTSGISISYRIYPLIWGTNRVQETSKSNTLCLILLSIFRQKHQVKNIIGRGGLSSNARLCGIALVLQLLGFIELYEHKHLEFPFYSEALHVLVMPAVKNAVSALCILSGFHSNLMRDCSGLVLGITEVIYLQSVSVTYEHSFSRVICRRCLC